MHIVSRSLACAALAAGLMLSPAMEARPWKATPGALAQDYSVITDTRPDGTVVILLWFSSATLPPTMPGRDAAKAMLDENIMLGVVTAHSMANGIVTFDKVGDLAASTADGKPLRRISSAAMSPAAAGAVAAISAVMRQSMGKMGENMEVFAFAADGRVKPCSKGGISIPLAGETYTYDTPMPGCPAS